jgi:hypothetical protein
MKRNTLAVLILFCAAQIFAQTGVITDLTGTVELKLAGQANFVPAKSGDAVAKDTVVSTGFKSTALIKVGNTVLTVRPLTRLTLADISASAGTETINVNLQTGRVRVDVNPPAGTRASTTVRSPVATASVRGTSFEFDTRNLTVLTGTVAFRGNQGGVVLVSADSTSEVSNGKAADPIEIYTAGLLPPPVAGSDSGFHSGGSMTAFNGEFNLTLILIRAGGYYEKTLFDFGIFAGGGFGQLLFWPLG